MTSKQISLRDFANLTSTMVPQRSSSVPPVVTYNMENQGIDNDLLPNLSLNVLHTIPFCGDQPPHSCIESISMQAGATDVLHLPPQQASDVRDSNLRSVPNVSQVLNNFSYSANNFHDCLPSNNVNTAAIFTPVGLRGRCKIVL